MELEEVKEIIENSGIEIVSSYKEKENDLEIKFTTYNINTNKRNNIRATFPNEVLQYHTKESLQITINMMVNSLLRELIRQNGEQ